MPGGGQTIDPWVLALIALTGLFLRRRE